LRKWSGLRVKVGSVPQPMEENHFIEWIEATAEGKTYRNSSTPGKNPKQSLTLKRNVFQ